MTQILPPDGWNVSSLAGALPNFYANQVTGTFTAAVGNAYSVSLSAASLANLPDAAQNPGGIIAIVLTSAASHSLTLTPVAGQTISGASTLVLSASQNAVLLFSNGSNWDTLSSVTGTLGAAAYENLGNNVIDDGAGNLKVTLGTAAHENLLSTVVDDGAGNLKVANTAVAPGTYTTLSSITIAADGRITAYTA